MKKPEKTGSKLKYLVMIAGLAFIIIMYIMMYNLSQINTNTNNHDENFYPIELLD